MGNLCNFLIEVPFAHTPLDHFLYYRLRAASKAADPAFPNELTPLTALDKLLAFSSTKHLISALYRTAQEMSLEIFQSSRNKWEE